MKRRNRQNLDSNTRLQLECSLFNYGRNLLKERMREEKIPISSEALDEASEIYSQKIIKTIEICMNNLIEHDISNLMGIFEEIRKEYE